MKPVIVRLLPCLAALALAACASAPLAETRYRLPEPAPLSAAQPAMPALAVTVEQAAWLNGLAMHYQLDAQRPQLARYRDSLWADRPAALLAARLRQRLSTIPVAAGAPWSLRLYLDRFEQVYQPDLHSQGEARWQAELRDSHGALRARHTFSASAPAGQAHAEAGARALGAASDALIEDTLRWAREGMGR